jgi:hypothetical protein
MAFADGLQSGFNFAINAHKMKLLDEEERRSKEIFELEKQEKQADIDYRNYLMSQKEQNERESDALIEMRQASTERDQALTATTNYNLQQAKEASKENKELKSLLTGYSILEDMKAWADDPELSKRINTPVFETWAGNTIGAITNLRDQDNGFDILEVLDIKTFQALENLAPVLDSRDFSQLNESNSKDLTQLFKGSINKFLGKEFKDSDLEGQIIDVKLTGGFQAIENGANTLVEAEYTVLNSEGNKVKRVGFLPDTTTSIISSEIEADDAKAVSVGDLVDTVGVTQTILTEALKSPRMIDIAMRLSQRSIKAYYPPDRLQDAKMQVEASKIYSGDLDRYTATLAAYGGLDIADTNFDDPAEVDELLRTLKIGFPDLPIATQSDQDGKTVLAIPRGYETIYDLLGTQITTFEEAEQQARSGPGVLSRRVSVRTRPDSYTFGDLEIKSNANRSDFIEDLSGLIGGDVVETQVQNIEEEFRSQYGRDIRDEELLDQLNLLLRRRS